MLLSNCCSLPISIAPLHDDLLGSLSRLHGVLTAVMNQVSTVLLLLLIQVLRVCAVSGSCFSDSSLKFGVDHGVTRINEC